MYSKKESSATFQQEARKAMSILRTSMPDARRGAHRHVGRPSSPTERIPREKVTEFGLQMIAVVIATMKERMHPDFQLDHDGRQTLKGEIHLASNTTAVCSI